MLHERGDADRQAIAYYEVGHGVVARYLGRPVAVREGADARGVTSEKWRLSVVIDRSAVKRRFGCPLSGAKRTWPIALHMSANDPKRTWNTSQRRGLLAGR
jgi:hypothetical protein